MPQTSLLHLLEQSLLLSSQEKTELMRMVPHLTHEQEERLIAHLYTEDAVMEQALHEALAYAVCTDNRTYLATMYGVLRKLSGEVRGRQERIVQEEDSIDDSTFFDRA